MTADDIQQLLLPRAYSHAVKDIQLIETHISWVILTGSYAYKIKKPVNLGFLDFSALDQRKKYCQEELRLNRRTAEEIYLSVVEVRCSDGQLTILANGSSEAQKEESKQGKLVDYAVQMAQFDHNALLSDYVKQTSLPRAAWQQLAKTISEFHREAEVCIEGTFGSCESVQSANKQNFEQITPYLTEQTDIQNIKHIDNWIQEHSSHLQALIKNRKRQGFVRDCHGDLHLGNLAFIDGVVVPFDCIEFNEDFRIIDTTSEIAFTIMDLDARDLSQSANSFLNAYLEDNGDYQVLELLKFYKVYRAIVRAKVSLLSTDIALRKELPESINYQQFQRYVELAKGYIKNQPVFIAIMHGVSGSGKSYQAQLIAEAMGAIRIRSDVERKRLFGLAPEESSISVKEGGIYTADATEKTFTRLAELTKTIIDSGMPCIVDATFLHQARRDQFHQVAKECGVAFVIIDCQPPEETILERLDLRQDQGGDASEADEGIMKKQSQNQETLTDDEKEFTVETDTLEAIDFDALRDYLKIID